MECPGGKHGRNWGIEQLQNNWLVLQSFGTWINHLPPLCCPWFSTYTTWHLVCKFGRVDWFICYYNGIYAGTQRDIQHLPLFHYLTLNNGQRCIFLISIWYCTNMNDKCTRNHHEINQLQWCHSEHDGVSDHQLHDCLFNRFFFQAQSKENIKARCPWLCEGNSPVTDEFTHKGPVTRKMFPFDDVVMCENII